jgi:hypothetical protein
MKSAPVVNFIKNMALGYLSSFSPTLTMKLNCASKHTNFAQVSSYCAKDCVPQKVSIDVHEKAPKEC